MSEKRDGDGAHEHAVERSCRHGLTRRARLGVAAAALLGLGAVAGVLATASMSAGAHLWRGHHGGGVGELSEHARDKVSWMLSRVDATPEQEQQIDAIVEDLMSRLAPVREAHRANRRELVAELLREPVDPARVEAIRRDELALAETASAGLKDALLGAADVLTVEQREALLERISHRHNR